MRRSLSAPLFMLVFAAFGWAAPMHAQQIRRGLPIRRPRAFRPPIQMTTACGAQDNPCAVRLVVVGTTFMPATVPPSSGTHSFVVNIQNQSGSSANATFTCIGSTSLPCSVSPTALVMAIGETDAITVTYTATGTGTFAVQVHDSAMGAWNVIDVNDSTFGPITVAPSTVLTISTPWSLKFTAALDSTATLAATIDTVVAGTPYPMKNSSVRSLLDGIDRTSWSTVTDTSIRLRLAPLALGGGMHRWTVYGCLEDLRCDSVSASFTYPFPPPPPIPVWPVDDSVAPVAQGNEIIPGAIATPPDSLKGCPQTAGAPDVVFRGPVGDVHQNPQTVIIGSDTTVYPGGELFRAQTEWQLPLTVSLYMISTSGTSVPLCSQMTWLNSSQYAWQPGQSPSDPLWDGYPWTDVAPSAGRPLSATATKPRTSLDGPHRPLWHRFADSLVTRGGSVWGVKQYMLSGSQKLNLSTFTMKLNGVLIAGLGAKDPNVTGAAGNGFSGFTIAPSEPALVAPGWNELDVSIADSNGKVTKTRARFRMMVGGTATTPSYAAARDFTRSDQGACAAFGTFQCGSTVLTFTIPGFVTRDRDRSLHLIYRSATQGQPVVTPIEGIFPLGPTAPDSFWLQGYDAGTGATIGPKARFGGTQGVIAAPGNWPLYTYGGEDRVFGTTITPTGSTPLERAVQLGVTAFSGGTGTQTMVTQEIPQLPLRDTTTTHFGPGWQLAEFDRLVFATGSGGVSEAIWVSGDGSYVTFRQVGSAWIAPTGETTQLWTIPGDTVPYRLTPSNGAVLGFRSDGQPAWTQDLAGNKTIYGYSGSHLTTITDPAGIKYTLTYAAPGQSGLVSDVKMVAGGTTQPIASFRYDAGGRLSQAILWRGATAGDTTTYGYATSPSGAFVTSVTTAGPGPYHNPRVTTIAYDTTLWVPTALHRPPLNGAVDSTLYRDPWGRTLPMAAGTALPAPIRATYFTGDFKDASGRITEYSADHLGNPTSVTRLAPDSAVLADGAMGRTPGNDVRVIMRDSTGRVTQVTYGPAMVHYHYHPVFGTVDTLIRSTALYPASTVTADTLTFTFDSVLVGAAASAGRCYRAVASYDALHHQSDLVGYTSGATGGRQCAPGAVRGYVGADTATYTYPGGSSFSAGTPAGVRPSAITDGNGLTEGVTYDAATWNTATTTVPGAGTTRTTYDLFGRPVQVVTAAGASDSVVSRVARDWSGRVIAAQTGSGPVTRTFYDTDGAVDSTAISAGAVAANGTVTVTGPVQVHRTYYDQVGAADSTYGPGTLGLGGPDVARWQASTYNKDVAPTLTHVGNGATITTSYDWFGRPETVVQSAVSRSAPADGHPFGSAATLAFLANPVGLVDTIQGSRGQRSETWRDGVGRVTRTRSWDTGKGLVVEHTYGYTAAGALVADTTTFEGTARVVRRYQYDRLGRRTQVADTVQNAGTGSATTGLQKYFYNATTQRLDSTTAATGAGQYARVRWVYDRGGRDTLQAVQITTPGGITNKAEVVTRRHYNALGQLAADSVTRDSTGAAQQIWYRFGTPTYSTVGDLLTSQEMITHVGGTATTWSQTLHYSTDGQRRLIQSTKTYGQLSTQYNWTYDVFGNRASQVGYSTEYQGMPCLLPDTSWYGLDNRLTVGSKMTVNTSSCPARSTTYFYDFAGQRVASQDTVQGEATPAGRAVETYTAAGQLFFSLTPLPSGSANNYVAGWNWYGGDGLRAISKSAYSGSSYPLPDTTLAGQYTAYVYDGGQPVLLLQRTTTLGGWSVASRMVVAGVDRPLAGIYNGQYLALVADRGGTIQAGVQPTGAPDQLATYVDHGPFGNIEPTSGANLAPSSDVQAGFAGAGGAPNGLGLVYLRNRWYDPQTGRFLTQDPIGLAGGLNLYAYAGNNPTSFSDPFGLCPDPTDPACWEQSSDAGLMDPTAWFGPEEAKFGLALVGAIVRDIVDVGIKDVAVHEIGVQANRAAGQAGEALAKRQLTAAGENIIGSQVGIRTSQGLRVVDHLAQKADGSLVAYEVKTGGARRTLNQILKDGAMESEGGTIVGKNAPKALRGSTVKIPTIEYRP